MSKILGTWKSGAKPGSDGAIVAIGSNRGGVDRLRALKAELCARWIFRAARVTASRERRRTFDTELSRIRIFDVAFRAAHHITRKPSFWPPFFNPVPKQTLRAVTCPDALFSATR